MVISARRTWEANPRTNVETSVWRHWWQFWQIMTNWPCVTMDFIWWRWPKERGRQIQAQCSRLGIRQVRILDIGGSSRGWTSRADWGSSWERHRWRGGNLGWDEGFHPPISNLGRLHIRKVVTMAMSTRVSRSSRPRRRRRCRTWYHNFQTGISTKMMLFRWCFSVNIF